MSDYTFETDVLRGQMAERLSNNTEQFVFVMSDAFYNVDLEDALEYSEIGYDAQDDPKVVVEKMRILANAIEESLK